MVAALKAVDLFGAEPARGLVRVQDFSSVTRPEEGAFLRELSRGFPDVDYVFFRRFQDGRASVPAALVIDNSDERLSRVNLAGLHRRLWLQGAAPLVYVAWPLQIDVLACARGPDFWEHDGEVYRPLESIRIAANVTRELAKCRRFSAYRLADGTFWDDPANSDVAAYDDSAHHRLIQAIVEIDAEVQGSTNPALRRLLLLTVLIKYLEDRRVFPAAWFSHFHRGSKTFLDILRSGDPDAVTNLLGALQRRFNGDVFVAHEHGHLTKRALRGFADLVEARTLQSQRYLWEQFSFEHLPVEVISHLYQRFVPGQTAVYTPPSLASLLLDQVMPYGALSGKERVLDPSCGSGIFLVGAYRRLVNVWRKNHSWRQPKVSVLKEIQRASIFGVEIDQGAADLTAFSLALAVCDALQPNVIWKELRFDRLVGTNIRVGDFFDVAADWREPFNIVVGNPPFESKLTDAAESTNAALVPSRGKLPDRQSAYLFFEQALTLLHPRGSLCLVQPSGLLYNRNAASFRRALFAKKQIRAVFDFTSIRNLYDGADPKTIAVFAHGSPTDSETITHLTFRRTFAVGQRLGFEIDHYDRHRVSQSSAEQDQTVWRANLLGGGRLHRLAERLAAVPRLLDSVKEKGWLIGEGYIVGSHGEAAPFLTGKPLLPTAALDDSSVDTSRLSIVEDRAFQWPRRPELFRGPLVIIREHESLPMAFWPKGPLAYKAQIVGISAGAKESAELESFFKTLLSRRRFMQLACLLNGSWALIGKATAILKADIEGLPSPTEEVDMSFWETILQDDLLDHFASYIRLGQNSEIIRRSASDDEVSAYSATFCRLLGTVYPNLQALPCVRLGSLICQPFQFGQDALERHGLDKSEEDLRDLVYETYSDELRTTRLLRIYFNNTLLIVKPDRLRYWLRSTAIADTDETLGELYSQGY